MEEIINEYVKGSIRAREDFFNGSKSQVMLLAGEIIDTIRLGGKILIFGNGGSAADAQHMAGEFVNRFQIDRPPLAAIALTTDSSILTCIGNDFSFDDIFVKQILALGKKDDLALGISTSGNSPNVLKAIETARKMGLKTAALTGGTGGKLIGLADIVLTVPSSVTPFIQETHLVIEHLLCLLVDKALFGENAK